MKVLIAEDERSAARVLSLILEQEGHEVRIAANGLEAVEILQTEEVKLVLSDWQMPLMDGLQLCAHIRAAGGSEYTYFILLTGTGLGRENLRLAMDAGVDDFLAKPLDHELLLMRLRVASRILEQTRQIRTLTALVPICMYCKRIRDDRDYWQQLEIYWSEHTGSQFSHGVCPDCFSQKCGGNP